MRGVGQKVGRVDPCRFDVVDFDIEISIKTDMKPLFFHAGSRDDYKKFPALILKRAGFQLDRVQRGLDPDDWKPMNTIGPGVKEVRIKDSSGAYRVIYVATFAEGVFVLHAFQKKRKRLRCETLPWRSNDSRI